MVISTVLTGEGLKAGVASTPFMVKMNPKFATKRSYGYIMRAGEKRALNGMV